MITEREQEIEMLEKRRRLRLLEEALRTPFITLNRENGRLAISNWKIRVLRQGVCKLRYLSGKEDMRCIFCLLDSPYKCKFRSQWMELVGEEVFRRDPVIRR